MNNNIHEHLLTWQATQGDFIIDVSMDVRVHTLKSKTVVIILPGIDGSVDGYENKYIRMAERIVERQHKAVVRLSNHFITSLHWEDNLRRAIEYVDQNAAELFGHNTINVEIFGHSAGAAMAARLAWEYPEITKLLLVNMAAALAPEKILTGLTQYKNEYHLVFGSEDPSVAFTVLLPDDAKTTIIEGADHYFSDEHLESFITLVDLLEDPS